VKEFFAGKNHLRKSWLIENPISDTYFNIKWNPVPFRILSCGRICLRKNTLNIIKSFDLISKKIPEAELVIAGSIAVDLDYVEKCKQLISELGLDEKVSLLGNISIKTVQEELARANCLLLPSYQETAPLAIEEAMAVGVPVVTSNSCGMPYMVDQGKTGFLIDPNDTTDIADAVSRILSDKDLAESMSVTARKSARERFMASKVTEQTLAVYKQILAGEC
jgi:glycosyltransferase involved in cell wall biosynthesis